MSVIYVHMRNFTSEECNEITQLYKDGLSLQEIASKYNCSRRPIARVLRDAEIPIRTNGEHNRSVIQDGKKYCSLGKHWEDINNFYKQQRYDTGYVSFSYACRSCMQDKWHEDWARHVAKKFGITVEQYQAMLTSQNNLCAICKASEKRMLADEIPQRLSVDHNHATGAVRGLLCNQCNSLLGMAKDNIEILQNAIYYLELHNGRQANDARLGTGSD